MNTKWNRPKTTRRYLHPPLSERLYTIWCDAKIVLGENVADTTNDYRKQVASGIRFMHGGDRTTFDFRTVKNTIPENGIPHHGLIYETDGLTYRIEAISECTLRPACLIRVVAANNRTAAVSDTFSFMLRSGMEHDLVRLSPDVYGSYECDLETWNVLPSTWSGSGNMLTDGDRWVSVSGDMDFVFDEKTGTSSAEIMLAPGESAASVFVYDRGAYRHLDYDAQKQLSREWWEKELSKINKLPEALKNDRSAFLTVENLCVQLLQCFSQPVTEGDDRIILARQGGLQRRVWAFETMPVLESLSRIGDFDDYIEPVIDSYFGRFFTESGEIVPWSIHWAMITGNVLYSFSKYAVIRGKEYYLRYRDRAMRSFEWMKNTRASVTEAEYIAPGLFPPMSSCDDPLVMQSWTNTDSYNIIGLGALLEAAELFGDERAEEIRRERDDYRHCARREWERIIREAGDVDELDFPLTPRGNNAELKKKFAFTHHVPMISFDFTDSEVALVYNYRKRRNLIRGGLYSRMPDKNITGSTRFNLDKNGVCVVWYVCCQEAEWFEYYRKTGQRERMLEILEDNRKYAMTDEYYMLERYHEDDPYFTPWMPNASANGRTILMLLGYYAGE